MNTAVSYCRLCPATCGLLLEVHEGHVTKISGDPDHALTRGFTCTKGRHLADFVTDPGRLRSSKRRVASATDGSAGQSPVLSGGQSPVLSGGHSPVHEDIDSISAVGEIAARLTDIIQTHGPDSVALYTGTSAAMASLTLPFTLAFWKTIGSRSKYSSMSVDQSAKWVTENRMGRWAAGSQRFTDSDVWMLVGTNPLISMQGGYFTGFPIHDGMRRLAEEKRRGLKLIVVDPRRTEIATRADIHLQIIPGTDTTLFAGILNYVITRGFADEEFCSQWAPGLGALARAVLPFTPDKVASLCGIPVVDFERAAEMFGQGEKGMVTAGTGPDMGPAANLAEHLIQAVNVVCGRYPRAGDSLAGTAVLGSAKPLPAQALAPDRHWENGYKSSSGFGLLNGELPAVTIPEAIEGKGGTKIRAMIVSGGNPADAVPGRYRMAQALSSLDLLVTVDPFMSATAKLADYVIAPIIHLERPDSTRSYEGLMDRAFSQYTEAILPAPPGLLDDWEFFTRLANEMGSTIRVAGREYEPGKPLPATDEVLASFSARGRVSLEEVKAHPHGKVFDEVQPVQVAEPSEDADGFFDVAPSDIVEEIGQTARGLNSHMSVDENRKEGSAVRAESGLQLQMITRRVREVVNSTGTQIAGLLSEDRNPCRMNPTDMESLGVTDGDSVTISTQYGSVRVKVQSDSTLRPEALSLAHGFGGPGVSGDGSDSGVSVNDLLSPLDQLQPVSGMPLMSAIPITVVGS